MRNLLCYVFLQFVRRPSLIPPPDPGIEWENYLNTTAGKPPCLGRHLISKESTKSFKATIAMVYIKFSLCYAVCFNRFYMNCKHPYVAQSV